MDHELVRRRDAAEASLRMWETLKWRMGSADCVRMMAHHLRMLGYKVKLPAAGSYRTVKTALIKMEEMGHANLAEAIDSLGLPRIAPAAAIVGDLVQLPGEDENDRLGAITIAMGNGRVLGWHDDAPHGAVIVQP